MFLGLFLVLTVVTIVSGSDAMGRPATVCLLFLIVGLTALQMGTIHALAWVVRTRLGDDRARSVRGPCRHPCGWSKNRLGQMCLGKETRL